jgi:hypothetical protein
MHAGIVPRACGKFQQNHARSKPPASGKFQQKLVAFFYLFFYGASMHDISNVS